MQTGSTLINIGSTSKKNTHANLTIKLFETTIGVLAFWLVGYGIAFGKVDKFLGLNINYYAAYGFE